MQKNDLEKYNYCQKAIDLKQDLESGFISLAEALYHIKEYALYRGSWGSWEEYTEELKMSSNTINKLIQIYRNFVVEYGLRAEHIKTAGGWSVVADLLPVAKSKKEALSWLNKASVLTRADLRKELTEAKTGVPMKTCTHSDTYTVEICKCCGERIRKY